MREVIVPRPARLCVAWVPAGWPASPLGMASQPDPHPAGGTRAPSPKSIPASRTKFLIFQALATTCSHRLLTFLYFLFHPDQIRFILTSMDQQSSSIARLKEVWRSLRIFEQRRQRLADELGLSVAEVERMVRAACETKPVGGQPKNWSVEFGFGKDDDGPIPFHRKRSTIALRVAIERAMDPSLVSNAAVIRKLVAGHAQPGLSVRDRATRQQSLKDALKGYFPSARASSNHPMPTPPAPGSIEIAAPKSHRR